MNSIPDPRSGISEKDETSIVDVEVLIIGGGPTGLMAAYMLSKLKGTHSFVSIFCKFRS